MYPRALRIALNLSTKLSSNQKIYKNTSLTLPIVTLVMQKNLPSYYNTVRHFSDDLSENNSEKVTIGTERKQQIDERAQAKLNAMIAEKPELEKLLKILEVEINVLKENGENVPSILRPRHWLELIQISNAIRRKKYLHFLFTIEKKHEKKKQRQEESNIILEKVREERENRVVDPNEMIYGFGFNTMFRRIVDNTMNKLWNWNCIKSIMYGNKIVFDCSYEPHMRNQEIKSCAKQIMESFALNRLHNYPFEILLCNVNFSGQMMEELRRFIPTLLDDDFPMTITSKSYLECFKKDSLVYLTSNAPKMLEKYDPESVYIIGAYVDKGSRKQVSLGKAKEENLRMAKLPIDRYIHFGDGSGKDLTLNSVIGVMLDAQTGDWEKAMSHIPRRKTFESRMHAMERRLQKEMQFATKNLNDGHIRQDKIIEPMQQSTELNDYSHAARAKLRKQWSEGQ